MSVIKAKKAEAMDISDFSFRDVSTFDCIEYDNDLNNLLIKKKQNPQRLKEVIKEFKHEVFTSGEEVVELEDFTDEVRKIEQEQNSPIAKKALNVEEIAEDLENSLVVDSPPPIVTNLNSLIKEKDKLSSKKSRDNSAHSANMVEEAIEDMSLNLSNSVEKVDIGSKLFHEALANPDKFSLTDHEPPEKEELPKATKIPFTPPVKPQAQPQQAPIENTTQLALEEKKGFEKGYAEGFNQGEQKGYIGVATRVDTMFSKMSELFTELGNLRHQIAESMEDSFVIVVEKMVKKIIRQEMSFDSQILKNIFIDVITKTSSNDKVKVKINRHDYDFINQLLPDLKKQFDQIDIVSLVKDDSLMAGDFILETPTSLIESNIEKHINTMIEGLDLSMVEKAS